MFNRYCILMDVLKFYLFCGFTKYSIFYHILHKDYDHYCKIFTYLVHFRMEMHALCDLQFGSV
jgi:hypothetical protein